jgi:diguanylate cyclase (GGDEF)-like protein
MSANCNTFVPLGDALLRQALDMSTEGVVVLECDGEQPCVRYANSQFIRLSGFTLDELATLKWPDLCRDICAEEVTDSLAQNSGYSGSLLMERADGTRWRTGVRIRRLMGEQGDANMWLCQFVPCALLGNGDTDFAGIWFDAEAANSRNRIGRLDRIDGSSGLLRFERFRDFLDRDIALARREKKAATLMLLKIMEFDEYRCTFGVNAANSCLRMIGKQVTASLRRRTDLCARMSEDTIAAALFGQTSDLAWKMLDRISENVDGLRVHNPRGRLSRFLTLRCAVVSSEPVSDECSVDTLLEAAESDLARVAMETMSA